MSIAKVISLLACFIYLVVFISCLFFPETVKETVAETSQLGSSTVFAIIIAFTFFLAVINFCYFYFLQIKSKNGENLDSAVFYSIQLFLLPLMVLAGIVVMSTL